MANPKHIEERRREIAELGASLETALVVYGDLAARRGRTSYRYMMQGPMPPESYEKSRQLDDLRDREASRFRLIQLLGERKLYALQASVDEPDPRRVPHFLWYTLWRTQRILWESSEIRDASGHLFSVTIFPAEDFPSAVIANSERPAKMLTPQKWTKRLSAPDLAQYVLAYAKGNSNRSLRRLFKKADDDGIENSQQELRKAWPEMAFPLRPGRPRNAAK